MVVNFLIAVSEEYISGWRIDKNFYKKDIEKLFSANDGGKK